MTPIPLTFCLFTTTKGHWGRKDRYARTLDSFNAALPLTQYEARLAHIKITPGDEKVAALMTEDLVARGFRVLTTGGVWSHSAPSHQFGYLSDALKVYTHVTTPYVFHCEDDFEVAVDGEYIDWVYRALLLLEREDSLLQVRIPRFTNERARIDALRAKHAIPSVTSNGDAYHFRHNDLSMNPSFFRARDIRAALMLVAKSNIDKHIEHGTGAALKVFSDSEAPFACFEPSRARVAHIGAPVGLEDDLTQPLIAT